MPYELTKFYSAEIILALEECRKHKIVHWDLKPENILLEQKWHSKLADFGDSKIINEREVLEELKNID